LPIAVLLDPIELPTSASFPIPVLKFPDVLENIALTPLAVFPIPIVLF